MTADVRVCFVGDSFVAGVGDPQHLGWTGRLAARSHAHGTPLTHYDLGVRRQTTTEVLARWRGECAPRLPPGTAAGVVVSFGVNDTTVEDGRPRVDPAVSVENLESLVCGAGWPVLVVGPPAVDDDAQNDRTAWLDDEFARVCAAREIGYVSVLASLRTDEVWRREVGGGDGAHPGAAGYAVLSDLVRPSWEGWLRTLH